MFPGLPTPSFPVPSVGPLGPHPGSASAPLTIQSTTTSDSQSLDADRHPAMPTDLSGTWNLLSSDNFEGYMLALGKTLGLCSQGDNGGEQGLGSPGLSEGSLSCLFQALLSPVGYMLSAGQRLPLSQSPCSSVHALSSDRLVLSACRSSLPTPLCPSMPLCVPLISGAPVLLSIQL